jgi:hypothetical protein
MRPLAIELYIQGLRIHRRLSMECGTAYHLLDRVKKRLPNPLLHTSDATLSFCNETWPYGNRRPSPATPPNQVACLPDLSTDRAQTYDVCCSDTLRRTNATPNCGYWQPDDFDVFDGDREVGRIYGVNRPDEIWSWGIGFLLTTAKATGTLARSRRKVRRFGRNIWPGEDPKGRCKPRRADVSTIKCLRRACQISTHHPPTRPQTRPPPRRGGIER